MKNGPRQRDRTAHGAGLQPAGFTSFLAEDGAPGGTRTPDGGLSRAGLKGPTVRCYGNRRPGKWCAHGELHPDLSPGEAACCSCTMRAEIGLHAALPTSCLSSPN